MPEPTDEEIIAYCNEAIPNLERQRDEAEWARAQLERDRAAAQLRIRMRRLPTTQKEA